MINNTEMQKKLYDACKSENFKIIKHILESKYLKQQIDLFADDSLALRLMCEKCNEELIDYILSFDEIKDSLEIKNTINNIFGFACYENKLNVLSFYFKNDKYNKYIDFNYLDGWFFRTAYQNNRIDVLNFLILDVGIKENKDVINTMNNQKVKIKEYVKGLFTKKEFNNRLFMELKDSKIENKKIKI